MLHYLIWVSAARSHTAWGHKTLWAGDALPVLPVVKQLPGAIINNTPPYFDSWTQAKQNALNNMAESTSFAPYRFGRWMHGYRYRA